MKSELYLILWLWNPARPLAASRLQKYFTWLDWGREPRETIHSEPRSRQTQQNLLTATLPAREEEGADKEFCLRRNFERMSTHVW